MVMMVVAVMTMMMVMKMMVMVMVMTMTTYVESCHCRQWLCWWCHVDCRPQYISQAIITNPQADEIKASPSFIRGASASREALH